MPLLTAELHAQIPALYSQEHLKLEDKILDTKFSFQPVTGHGL